MVDPKFQNSDQQEYYDAIGQTSPALTLTPAILAKRAKVISDEIAKQHLADDVLKQKRKALFWAFKEKLKENSQQEEFKKMLVMVEEWDDLMDFLRDQVGKKPAPESSKIIPVIPPALEAEAFGEFRIIGKVDLQNLRNRFTDFVQNNPVLLGLQLILTDHTLKFEGDVVKKDAQKPHLARFLYSLIEDRTIDANPVKQAGVLFPGGTMFPVPKPVPNKKKVDDAELAKGKSSLGVPLLRPKNPTEI